MGFYSHLLQRLLLNISDLPSSLHHWLKVAFPFHNRLVNALHFMSQRRVADLRRSAICHHASMRLLHRGKVSTGVIPMHDRRFVTPNGQPRHDMMMCVRIAVLLHRCLIFPSRDGPVRLLCIPNHLPGQESRRTFCLSTSQASVPHEGKEIAP